ncbi:MAG: DUF2062 domain-containing protein [Gammaproteobacteria bacterium]|nr:MAG: DUF2062 domain-containing protein [Gammaproteobacteria bacterium]
MRMRIITWLVTKYTDIHEHKSLGIFGKWLDDPYLFHLNKRSVPGAFALGLFCAWIPFPSQMIISAALAILIRVNVPLSVLLVWVTNPITIPPMFYFAYLVGTWVTGEPPQHFEIEPTWSWLEQSMQTIGKPLLLGCLFLGILSSVTGYTIMRLYWNKRLSRFLTIKLHRHRRHRAKMLLIKKQNNQNSLPKCDIAEHEKEAKK